MLESKLIDLIDNIDKCDDETAWQKATEFFEQYGFHITNFGLIDKSSQQLLGFHSNMRNEWMQYYMDMNYAADDPFASYVKESHNSLLYCNKTKNDLVIEKGSRAEDMLLEVKQEGFESSYCIPIHNNHEDRVTGFNLVSEMSAIELQKILSKHENEIKLGAALINNKMKTIPITGVAKGQWKPNFHNEILISEREIEVLKWLSEGNRNDRIAEKMNIAAVTVNFHLSEIKRKLGSKTREQSVAIAFKKGLLR